MLCTSDWGRKPSLQETMEVFIWWNLTQNSRIWFIQDARKHFPSCHLRYYLLHERNIILRRREKVQERSTPSILWKRFQLRFFVKCWVEFDTSHSMRIMRWSIKRCNLLRLNLTLGIRHSWKTWCFMFLLRLTSDWVSPHDRPIWIQI